MYDDIEVLCPIPGLPEGNSRQFQTKSLECALTEYTVSAEGYLMCDHVFIHYDGDIEFHDGVVAYIASFRDGLVYAIVPTDRYGTLAHILAKRADHD